MQSTWSVSEKMAAASTAGWMFVAAVAQLEFEEQAAIPAAPIVPGLPGGPARFDDQGRPLGAAVPPAG